MPSNALSARKGNPGTPKVCRVPPIIIIPPPPPPPAFSLIPPTFEAYPGVVWTETYKLEIPTLPPGTACTLDADTHIFADHFPATIHNYTPLEVILTPPWEDGDYQDTYTVTAPDDTKYEATLHVHVEFAPFIALDQNKTPHLH
jgi:hypothetical protein